jgi:hypothetical protein
MSRFAAGIHRLAGDARCGRGQLFCGSAQEHDATANLASRIAGAILRRRLSRREQEVGAAVVHYATGAALGSAYAVATKFVPAVTTARGAAFGAAFWVMGDEVLLPAFGMLRPPRRYPAAAHLEALGEHVAYGIVTDGSERLLRRFL